MVNRTIEKILLIINTLIGAAVLALVILAKVSPEHLNFLEWYVTGNIVYLLYGAAFVFVVIGLILIFNYLPFKNSSVYVYSYAQKHKRVSNYTLSVAAKAAAEDIEGIDDVKAKILMGEFGSQLHLDIKLDKRFDFSLVTQEYFPILEETIKNNFGIRFPCYKFAHGKVAYEYSLPGNIPVADGHTEKPAATESAELKAQAAELDGQDKKDDLAFADTDDDAAADLDKVLADDLADEDIEVDPDEIRQNLESMMFGEDDTESAQGEDTLLSDADRDEQDYVNRQIIDSLNEAYDEDYLPLVDEEQVDYYMAQDAEEAQRTNTPTPPPARPAPAYRTAQPAPAAARRTTTANGSGRTTAPPSSTAVRGAGTSSAPKSAARTAGTAATAKPGAAKAKPAAARAKTTRPAAAKTNSDVYDRINAIIDKYTKPQGKDNK